MRDECAGKGGQEMIRTDPAERRYAEPVPFLEQWVVGSFRGGDFGLLIHAPHMGCERVHCTLSDRAGPKHVSITVCAGVCWEHSHPRYELGGPMTAITLAQADRLIDAILARGAELDCRPLAVIVVEPGCKVKAFKKEDGSSMIRFEMAYGKA